MIKVNTSSTTDSTTKETAKPEAEEAKTENKEQEPPPEKGKQFHTSIQTTIVSEKSLVVCTPYGYAKVEIEKFKLQLEEDAKKSLQMREVIAEFVKEKELALKLDLEAKEKEEAEEEKGEEEKKEEEDEEDREPELYCRNKHRLVKCLGRDTCPYGGGAMCDKCGHGINLD